MSLNCGAIIKQHVKPFFNSKCI